MKADTNTLLLGVMLYAVAVLSFVAYNFMDHRSQGDIALENHHALMERLGFEKKEPSK